jgi:hypothetical protein
VGDPIPYLWYWRSSGNLIHHAYHLAQFEEKAEVLIHEIDYVFEFGGGYGSMCRLFFNLGFRGRYIIFDLPPFSALQAYFLKTLGLTVKSALEAKNTNTGIICLSDIQDLISLLRDRTQPRKDMFVATWSISECPIITRESILPLVSDFQTFMIAYQDTFGEVDNREFFYNWMQTIADVRWNAWQIEHLPGNNYLVGGAKPGRVAIAK